MSKLSSLIVTDALLALIKGSLVWQNNKWQPNRKADNRNIFFII